MPVAPIAIAYIHKIDSYTLLFTFDQDSVVYNFQ